MASMATTRTWTRGRGRRAGPWHLTGPDSCGAHFTEPDTADFETVPEPYCRPCAARRRHQLSHPEPIEPVAHDDLDLNDEADRSTYRKRVAQMFELTQINLIIQHVLDAGGPRPPARRIIAVEALADAWICASQAVVRDAPFNRS
jgi:hypothetical protein